MNALGIVLIARLGSLEGISYVYDRERNMLLGHIECLLEITLNSLVRICTAPNSAETEISRAEKYILYSGSAILDPIFGNRLGKCS